MKAKISGMVVAGFPSPAEQYQEPLGLRLPSKADAFSADMLDLNELLVKRPAATFFVRVQGDSMVGAGIHDVAPCRVPARGRVIARLDAKSPTRGNVAGLWAGLARLAVTRSDAGRPSCRALPSRGCRGV